MESQPYVLRRFELQDLPAVMRINATCLPENYSEYFYLSLHEEAPDTFQVAKVGDTTAGYVMCRLEKGFSDFSKWKLVRKGHVVSIAVLPEFRRLGIGRSLMKEAMAGMRGYGMKECFLEVRVSNGPAIELYESLGFQVARTVQGYYNDGESAHVMAIDFGKT